MPADSHYDVVIIGSGAGGGTLAWKLAPSGRRVLLVERGDYLPRERDNWETTAVFLRGKYLTTETWRDGGSDDEFTPEQNYYVGGNTKFYGAALFRLRPEDFGEIRHHGGISPSWPLDYDRLRTVVRRGRGAVHGARRGGRGPDRRAEERTVSPIPRCGTSRGSSSCHDDLERLGLHPSHLPIGVMLDQDDDGEAVHGSRCIRCDRVDGFPCLVEGKADAQTVCVDPALASHPNLDLSRTPTSIGSRPTPTGDG